MKNLPVSSISCFLMVLMFSMMTASDGSQARHCGTISRTACITEKHSALANTYSSEVALKWIDMQLELMRTSDPFIGGLPPSRVLAYTGIALYESVLPGMPGYQTLSGQLSDMPDMPGTIAGQSYHWPTCANAALAMMSRNFFPHASKANQAAMDVLENELYSRYKMEAGRDVVERSSQFGKTIAKLIFNWSVTDGASNANVNYIPQNGPGLWAPTPPDFTPAFGPYWGNNRLMVTGSLDGSEPPAPPKYSTDPASEYYRMVKEVYDISKSLTPDQIALALYYRDFPGYGDGHYLSILKQILEQEKPSLDLTATVLAKTGIACVDAGIGTWKTKFQYNQERPIKYIREVMNHPEWNTLIVTPPFPDFPSGHSAIAGSFVEILKGFFGNDYHFTDHTYDYLGMPPRIYRSFDELAKEVCDSRLYAGIHYRHSCTQGLEQGKIIGQNIDRKLKFKKK